MAEMQILALVRYGGKVRGQKQHAALAREEKTAAVYRHPRSGGGGGGARVAKCRRRRRPERHWRPRLDPIPEEEIFPGGHEAPHPTVADVKSKKPWRSAPLAAAMARARSWIKRDIGGVPAFPTSVPWTMAF